MNKIKALLFAFACMFAPALAQEVPQSTIQNTTQVASQDVAFSQFYVSIEGGEIYPFGDLIDAVENTFYGGVGIRYSYWDNADGFMSFNYSYFRPVPKTKIDGVHQFAGKVGMDWKPRFLRPLVIGAGFACNFTRADIKDGVDVSFEQDLGGTLADNETEFGAFVRANLPLWTFEKFRVGFNVQLEELWTLPKRSVMMTMGFYVERRVW
mgnify:CR=1 FL=1